MFAFNVRKSACVGDRRVRAQVTWTGGSAGSEEDQAAYCAAVCDDYLRVLTTLVDRVLEEKRHQDVVRIKLIHNGQ